MSSSLAFKAWALLAAAWLAACADASGISTASSASTEALPLRAAYERWRTELLRLATDFDPSSRFQIELDETRRDFSATTELWQPTAANGAGARRRIVVRAGLLQAAELTEDGLALLLCHELGHAFAGYPFMAEDRLAAAEGSADYFATHVCGPILFARQPVESSALRLSGSDRAAIAMRCAQAGAADGCTRLLAASLALAGALAVHFGAEGGSVPPYSELVGEPALSDEDSFRVARTVGGHYPSVQCRLDTLVRGALCGLTTGEAARQRVAPPQTERAALAQSCSMAEFEPGARPSCWFREGSTPTGRRDALELVWRASDE